jgi:N-hydroxyarylamine O-acetyltransferase
MTDDEFLAAYLGLLGVERANSPSLELLRELHVAHLHRIPFENLSIHLGEPLSLEADRLAEKVLCRSRGGFCYELNGIFARLLELLGFRVILMAARVWAGAGLGPPLDHLVLRIETGTQGTWLADVGFGDHSVYPIEWEANLDQQEPGGTFRLEPQRNGDIDLYRNGSVQYRIETHPRILSDFEGMCWYHQTSPDSHFTRSLVCTRRTSEGRVTLSGRRLITTTESGRTEIELEGDDAVLDAYRTHFRIELERVPEITSPATASGRGPLQHDDS